MLTIIDATASRRWAAAGLREFVTGKAFPVPEPDTGRSQPLVAAERSEAPRDGPTPPAGNDQVNHGNLAYSACASFRTRMSGSAFFQSVKRSL